MCCLYVLVLRVFVLVFAAACVCCWLLLLCAFVGEVACVRACVCCRVCVLLSSFVAVVVCV